MACHISFRSVTFEDHVDTVTVVVITDVPCWLRARVTDHTPRKYKRTVLKRGWATTHDAYQSFTVYEDTTEDDPGENYTHVFTIGNWSFCFTKWLYFWGSRSGEVCVSTSPIFKHHNSLVTPVPGSLSRRVASGNDDAQRGYFNGVIYFGAGYGYNTAGYPAGGYRKMGCGMRFLDIAIPPGSILASAKLTFNCYTGSMPAICRTKIRGEKSIYPIPFSTQLDFDSRIRTWYVKPWYNIEPWLVNNNYDSVDFTGVVREITHQAGWSSGNPIVLFWDDFDDISEAGAARWAQSYNSIPYLAPLLTISWKPP